MCMLVFLNTTHTVDVSVCVSACGYVCRYVCLCVYVRVYVWVCKCAGVRESACRIVYISMQVYAIRI